MSLLSQLAALALAGAGAVLLPAALFLADAARRPLSLLVLLVFALAFVAHAGNYYWPLLIILLPAAWLFLREAIAPADLPGPPADARTRALVALLIAVLLLGWFVLYLPQLDQVASILPADSPADVFSGDRLARDFKTNRGALVFVWPWLLLLVIVFVRIVAHIVRGGRR